MSYLPHTPEDRERMLAQLGISSVEELLSPIPESLRLKSRLDLPAPAAEAEVAKWVRELSLKNQHLEEWVSFLGAGAYDHLIPTVVGEIISRPEFYTAYTPYQAEVSQGTLQVIYEYQSLICALFGMEVSNASMYDGGSALAEAAHMARSITGRDELLLSETIHPFYQRVVATYNRGGGLKLLPSREGRTDLAIAESLLSERTAALIVQHPNFFGCLEPVSELAEIAHRVGALFLVSVDPISLGLLAPPGEYGADIAVAEGQSLGVPLSLGGPYLGIFTTRREYIRALPGRLIGRTEDNQGRQGFVMVLQTREQHIRRERATSNICTNEALCALAATVYLSLLGPKGLREVAEHCLIKAHYLAQRIGELPGYRLAFKAPFFKEFVVRTPIPPAQLISEGLEHRLLVGVDLGRFDPTLKDGLLVCVTERRSKGELDRLVQFLGRG